MWTEQNSHNDGSLNPSIYEYKEEYLELEEGDENYIEFLQNEPELQELSEIFLLIPWDYSDGIILNKNYYAMKDLLKLYKYDLKTTIPLFLQMSNIWANNKREQIQNTQN